MVCRQLWHSVLQWLLLGSLFSQRRLAFEARYTAFLGLTSAFTKRTSFYFTTISPSRQCVRPIRADYVVDDIAIAIFFHYFDCNWISKSWKTNGPFEQMKSLEPDGAKEINTSANSGTIGSQIYTFTGIVSTLIVTTKKLLNKKVLLRLTFTCPESGVPSAPQQ